MSIVYLVEDASAAKEPFYLNVLATLDQRHESLEALAATARADLDAADAARSAAVTATAGGKHDKTALTAAIRAKADAESHLSALTESLEELQAERASALAVWERCARASDMIERDNLQRAAHAAAEKLDAASAVFNEAYGSWKSARLDVANHSVRFNHVTSAAAPAFKAVGPGWEASASLHADVRRDLSHANFANNSGSVANPRVG